jgi:hypothetical protein
MSEYQFYEFVAVDDPLTPRSMAALMWMTCGSALVGRR